MVTIFIFTLFTIRILYVYIIYYIYIYIYMLYINCLVWGNRNSFLFTKLDLFSFMNSWINKKYFGKTKLLLHKTNKYSLKLWNCSWMCIDILERLRLVYLSTSEILIYNMKYSSNKICVSKCNRQIYRDHYPIKFVRTTYL